MGSRLIAIDGNSLLFRAFYALPDMRTSDGTPTGALHGFLMMLAKLLETDPSHMIVAFDVAQPTFRHNAYSEYKAGRRETPPELLAQIPILQDLLKTMGICVCTLPGYEADDIIGTMSLRAEQDAMPVSIVTGDRDSFQLISDRVHVIYTRKGISETEEYTSETLLARYGLEPRRMIDLKGLMGDSSDNIPGIPGVGEKTALRLLEEYGTLEGVLAHAEEIKGKLGERVRDHRDLATLSYALGTIDRSIPLSVTLEDCAIPYERLGAALPVMKKLEMRAASAKYERYGVVEVPKECSVLEICSEEELKSVLGKHSGSTQLAFSLENGVSFAFEQGCSYRIVPGKTLFDEPIDEGVIAGSFGPFFCNEDGYVLLYDAKRVMHFLARYGLPIKCRWSDCMIADYLVNTLHPAASMQDCAERYLSLSDDHAGLLFELEGVLREKLSSDGLQDLYDLEMKVCSVLFDMERNGFRVDSAVLNDLKEEFDQRSRSCARTIFELCGEEFNILSTKQLGTILFEKLGLPPQKKNKSGYSTDADTLEKLLPLHPVIGPIQEYRFLTKLKSTFLDGLLTAIRESDGKVHTDFRQCVTATGRLSSAEPNLQNIPVRTKQGRDIRRAFVADDGHCLVDADYSQIELRLLAHLSGDERMIAAFCEDADFHRVTASEVFGVPFDEVTSEMRSAAKAVNFGIVYGISDFGLSRDLNIPVKKAGDYIRRYFEHYPKVKEYLDGCIESAKAEGYAVTALGRRRAMPEFKSSNFNTRSFGDRVAMNMPIQGTAADLIKLAMVRCSELIAERYPAVRMIMQVHDELIFDVPEDLAEQFAADVKKSMESVYPMTVPLVAEVHIGRNWYETK